MKKRVGNRVGDTLVEVMLAVGIFSMVAIAVVSVVSGSTSGAQSALETTVTREEVDAQAEALRFIHAAYADGTKNNTTNQNKTFYSDLWAKITENANTTVTNDQNNVLDFYPATCDELYNKESTSNIFTQKAFVININNLGPGLEYLTTEDIVINVQNQDNVFFPASTYPRLIYEGENENGEGDSLVDQGTGTTISRVEGIYVIAFKDPGTKIVDNSGNVSTKSAYYDFYIRTCWYGTGAERPSTISTIVRLYNPNPD